MLLSNLHSLQTGMFIPRHLMFFSIALFCEWSQTRDLHEPGHPYQDTHINQIPVVHTDKQEPDLVIGILSSSFRLCMKVPFVLTRCRPLSQLPWPLLN